MGDMKPVNRWLELLSSRERRRAARRETPNLVAHYWDGAGPMAHPIRDISSTGIYLLTEQRWYPGTLVRLLLQRAGVAETDPDRSITVNAKVVRSGRDGVGFALLLPDKHSPRSQSFNSDGADRLTFNRFLQHLMGIDLGEDYLAGPHLDEVNLATPRDTEDELR